MKASDKASRPQVVIIGAGFGGLWAARTLARSEAEVTVIDKHDYHTFLALLYQVAAAELEAEDIAYPLRSIFREQKNLKFIMAEANRIEAERKRVMADGMEIPYDYLIVATGSVSHDFNIPHVSTHAYFLKTLDEAMVLKNHIICCFEEAQRERDEALRRRLLTFVIVGGGATGVEYAGALSELIYGPLKKDFLRINFEEVRIVMLEAAPRLLGQLPESIASYTQRRLEQMKVEIRLSVKVSEVEEHYIRLADGTILETETCIWTAGIKGEPLAAKSQLPVGMDNRVYVLDTLQVPDHPEIYVIGDLAGISAGDKVLPQVAQVAIQSGMAAAKNIMRQMANKTPVPFVYRDRGTMITIGRNAAAAVIYGRCFRGFPAWIIWLFIHLFNLIGFRNRIMVLINWAWDYIFFEKAIRFVFPSHLPCGRKAMPCPIKRKTSPPGLP